MKKKKTYILVVIVCILVVILGIGIWLLSILNNDINEDNNLDSEMNVEFISAELDTVNSVGYEDSVPDISIDGSIFVLNVNLKNPGDVIIYNMVLANKEDKTGVLSNDKSIFDVSGRGDVLDNIEYSFKYADGVDVKNGDEIMNSTGGENTNLVLTVRYKDDGVKLDGDTNITLKVHLLYKEK